MIFISMLGANGSGCLFVNISTESARRRKKMQKIDLKTQTLGQILPGLFLLMTNVVWIVIRSR